MALIFKSTSEISTSLSPRKKDLTTAKGRKKKSNATTIGAATSKDPTVPKASTTSKVSYVPKAPVSFKVPGKDISDPAKPPKPQERKDPPATSARPLMKEEKGKGLVPDKEGRKIQRKSSGIVLSEPDPIAKVLGDSLAIISAGSEKEELDSAVDKVADEIWDLTQEWQSFLNEVIPDQEKFARVV